MPRLKFEPLQNYPFRTELQLYTSHINHGNHLDNAQLVGLASEARLRFLRWLGYDEMDVMGSGTVVGDQGLQYLSEAFHGEILVFEMGTADYNRYGFDVCWQAHDKASGRAIARGKIGIVLFNYQERRPVELPDAVREKLQAVQAG